VIITIYGHITLDSTPPYRPTLISPGKFRAWTFLVYGMDSISSSL